MDNQKVIVTGVKRYKFEDRETGEILQGTNVFYSTTEEEDNNDLLGAASNKANLPYEQFGAFHSWKFPAVANMDVTVSFAGKTPRIKVKGFEYLGHIDTKNYVQKKEPAKL